MQVNFLCPSCSKENVYESAESAEEFRCEHCQAVIPLDVSDSIAQEGLIDRCILCGRDLFYLQKDFNRRLGCAILIVGGLASPWTYGGSLLAAAALDWILYRRLPEVTVCYVCNSIYRRFRPNPSHREYDLSVGELVEGSIRGEE